MLKLRFDVSQYSPEEIVVKTVDQKLMVSDIEKAAKISKQKNKKHSQTEHFSDTNR